jgi:DNA mismatch endonuclease (patch repair protein)
MSAVRGRDTRVELAVRKALFAQGFRYRVAPRNIPGKPDIAFIAPKVAVFVDGDFWHGNAWRLRGAMSNAELLGRWQNAEFWLTKIEANMQRDRDVDAELANAGWRVVRIWESEANADLAGCIGRIASEVLARSEAARRDRDPRPG